MLTLEQAMTGLGAIAGTGGISAGFVAWMGYLTEARKGRKPNDGALTVAIGDGFAKSKWDEVCATHLGTIAFALVKLVAIAEIEAEEQVQDKSFHDRLDTKTLNILKREIQAAMKD